jgi:dephospho-CoA kinase
MIVGLTGIHGSGKTSLSEMFEEIGFKKVKNPFTFSSEEAREIASDSETDQIKKAFFFIGSSITITRVLR